MFPRTGLPGTGGAPMETAALAPADPVLAPVVTPELRATFAPVPHRMTASGETETETAMARPGLDVPVKQPAPALDAAPGRVEAAAAEPPAAAVPEATRPVIDMVAASKSMPDALLEVLAAGGDGTEPELTDPVTSIVATSADAQEVVTDPDDVVAPAAERFALLADDDAETRLDAGLFLRPRQIAAARTPAATGLPDAAAPNAAQVNANSASAIPAEELERLTGDIVAALKT
ncbi:MAG: hypothetical protein KDK10_18970, partial [Maritimibacter sp.]|nr:hypothetical protein [Maritimibacter sp.]